MDAMRYLTVAKYESSNDLCGEFRRMFQFIRIHQLLDDERKSPWITIIFFFVRLALFVSGKNMSIRRFC